MKKNIFAVISDGAFVVIFSYLSVYAVTAYYLAKIPSAVIASAASVIALSVFSILTGKKRRSAAVTAENKNFAELVKYSLAFMPKSEYDTVAKRLKPLADGTNAVCDFGLKPLDDDSVAAAIAVCGGLPATVFAVSFDDSAKKLADCSDGKIRLMPLGEFISVFGKDDPILSYGFIPGKPKIKPSEIFRATLKPKVAIRFAFYGLLLLILSRFVFYHLLYIIVGCIFVLYALAAFTFGKVSRAKNTE